MEDNNLPIKRKPRLGSRLADLYLGQSSFDDLKKYVVEDLIVPKSMEFIDYVVTEASHAVLLKDKSGNSSRRHPSSRGNADFVPWNGGDGISTRSGRDIPVNEPRCRYDDIVFDSCAEAKEIYGRLLEYSEEVSPSGVSVADYYAIVEDIIGVDIKTQSNDWKWGWRQLTTDNTNLTRVRNGWLIRLPKIRPID